MVNCLGTRRCGGMVDTRDLKSLGRKTVPVRVGSPAPKAGHPFRGVPLFVLSVTTRTGGSISEAPKTQAERGVFGQAELMQRAKRVAVGSPAPKAGHPFRGVPLFVLSVTTRTGGSISEAPKTQAERDVFGQAELIQRAERVAVCVPGA